MKVFNNVCFRKLKYKYLKKVFKYFQIQTLLKLTPCLTQIACVESTANIIIQSNKIIVLHKTWIRNLSSLTNLKSSLTTKPFRAAFSVLYMFAPSSFIFIEQCIRRAPASKALLKWYYYYYYCNRELTATQVFSTFYSLNIKSH